MVNGTMTALDGKGFCYSGAINPSRVVLNPAMIRGVKWV